MAIILCEECKSKISDKANICPYCGCPIIDDEQKNDRKYSVVNGVKYDVTEIVELTLQLETGNTTLDEICKKVKALMDIASPVDFIMPVFQMKDAPKELSCETMDEFRKKQQAIQASKPHCPTCQSTNIKKISATEKTIGAIGFGLLSKTAKSQFECKNCGYKW